MNEVYHTELVRLSLHEQTAGVVAPHLLPLLSMRRVKLRDLEALLMQPQSKTDRLQGP